MKCQRIIIFFYFLHPLISFAQKVPVKKPPTNASYYSNRLHGFETSNGEVYNKNDFTAAHRSLPFNTLLLVTNKKNKKSVVVRINDRGPFVKSRVLDLSLAAAKKIEMVPFGIVPVKIEILTFLDKFPIPDSLLKDNSLWNCYGKKQKLYDRTIYIWQTDNWKHAFYMASNLNLDLKLNLIAVKVIGSDKNRKFQILVTGIKESKNAEVLLKVFRSQGFSKAILFNDLPEEVKQRDGQ